MARIAFVLGVCVAVVLLAGVEGVSLKDLFRRTTTEEPTTTTTTQRHQFYIYNNIPRADVGCLVHFECKKKQKTTATPKPCLKYCVKYIECPQVAKLKGTADQCAELHEELIVHEDPYDARAADATVNVMQVAMIDFPCQPGYLPDSRGRCREVW